MPAPSDYIYWVDRIDPDLADAQFSPSVINLAQLCVARFPTPKAFVVSPRGFTEMFEINQLKSQIYHFLDQIDLLKSESIEKASHSILSIFSAASFPDSLLYNLIKAYSSLPYSHVSVSLSVHSPHYPFPANCLPVLPVFTSGDANLIASIKLTWASLFSSPLLFLYKQHSLNPFSLMPNILVQSLPVPDVSGSIFTTHPTLNQKDVILIEAVFGLSSKLYSGHLNPDTYVLNRFSGRLIHSVISPQLSKEVFSAHHTTTSKIPLNQRNLPKLKPSQLTHLAKLASKMQQFFFYPQQVSWILGSGKVLITSTQPFSPRLGDSSSDNLSSLPHLLTGVPTSPGIVSGTVFVSKTLKLNQTNPSNILVIPQLSPELIPFLKSFRGVVSETGSQISHVAIISRELKIPCIVSVPQATQFLHTGDVITINGSSGDIFSGKLPSINNPVSSKSLKSINTATKIYIRPSSHPNFQRLGQINSDGLVSLSSESIYSCHSLHPRELIKQRKTQYIHQHLTKNLQQAALSFGYRPVLFQLSSLSSFDLIQLKKGSLYELSEVNPLLGFRGVTRHIADKSMLNLELDAFMSARSALKLKNLHLMITWCHTPHDLEMLKKLLTQKGILRSASLQLWLSIDLPINLGDISEYLKLDIDAVSINLDSLVSLLSGIDPEHPELYCKLRPNHPFVQNLLLHFLSICLRESVHVNLHTNMSLDPDLISFLIKHGVHSFSVSPSQLNALRFEISQSELSVIKTNKNL